MPDAQIHRCFVNDFTGCRVREDHLLQVGILQVIYNRRIDGLNQRRRIRADDGPAQTEKKRGGKPK